MWQPADNGEPIEKDEAQIWTALNEGYNVHLSGQAGSGKTHVLRRFVAHAEDITILCAPTGIAAFNVGGETLHRRLGLGLAEESADALWTKIQTSRRAFAKTWNFLTTDRILIIDEISMVHPEFFNKLLRLRELAHGKLWQMIVVGDFLQLGPVFRANEKRRFVFETEAWQNLEFVRIWLLRCYRQEDERFLRLLNHLRSGHLDADDCVLLRSRVRPRESSSLFGPKEEKGSEASSSSSNSKDSVLCIFPHRKTAEDCNQRKLLDLHTEITNFEPLLHLALRQGRRIMDHRERADAQNLMQQTERLNDLFPVYQVRLATGAQVMLRVNLNVSSGLCNGTVGIVTQVNADHVLVRFESQNEDTVLSRQPFRHAVGHTVELVLLQIPLSLAWASTIHKVQGLTLRRVAIDASCCFEAGQLYTGLSRVRRLEDLFLLDFDVSSVLFNAAAVEFETPPTQRTEQSAKRLRED